MVRFMLALVAMTVLSTSPLFPDDSGSDWPEFRGGERQGVSAIPSAPVRWSAESNVVWKTAVPGNGYSSPVVAGDSVYVTTAREVRSDEWLLSLFRVLIALGTAFAAWYAGRAVALRMLSGGLIGGIGVTLITWVFASIAVFSGYLMDLSRAPERAWIAGLVAAALGLVVSASTRSDDPIRRFSWSMLLVILSLVGILLIPDYEHAIAGAWLGDGAILTYGTILLILLMAVAVARSARVVVRSTAAVLAILIPPSLAAYAVVRNGWEVLVSDFSPTGVPLWLWYATAGFFALGVAAAVWRKFLRSSASGAAVVLFGTAALALGCFALLWTGIARAPYLAHGLGPFRPIPAFGWAAGAVCLAAWLAAFVASLGSKHNHAQPKGFASWLPYAAAATGLLFLVDARLLPKTPHLERTIVCIDREKGGIRWFSEGLPGEQGDMHGDNSPASPTPATDGDRVYAYFGTPGIICTDLRGRTLWINKELPFSSRNGVATSPILHRDKLILLSESDAGHWLAAFDCKTGSIVWKTSRTAKIHPITGNCRTPSIININGQPNIVVWGYEDITGYDLDGKELWSYPVGSFGGSVDPVSSLAWDSEALYMVGPVRTVAVALDRLGKPGPPYLWDVRTMDGAQCPSPVVVNGLLFDVSDMGRIYCMDTNTGNELWTLPTMSQHYASPIAAGHLFYFTDTKGTTRVVEAAGKLKLLSTNSLNDQTYATPAPVDGSLFFRTKGHVWRVH